MSEVNSVGPTESPASQRATRWSAARIFTLLSLVMLFAYYNSLSGGPVMDDYRITTDATLGNPFANEMMARPVIVITLSMNYWIDRYNLRGYHLVNAVIHLLTTFLLYDLIRRALQSRRFSVWTRKHAEPVAFLAALLWMIHPLNTQSVTYVIQRCESLAGMFFLLSLWCYVRARTSGNRWRWFIAGLLSNILGCGCKELMSAIPPTIILYEVAFISYSWRAFFNELRPVWQAMTTTFSILFCSEGNVQNYLSAFPKRFKLLWLVIVLSIIPPFMHLTILLVSGFLSGPTSMGFGVSLYTPRTYLYTQSGALLHYIQLALWPDNLQLDYLDWPAVSTINEVWPSGLLVLALLAVTGYGVIMNRTWGILAALFFIYLAPTSSIMPIQDAVFEHRMYIPLISVILLIYFAGIRAIRLAEAQNIQRVLIASALVLICTGITLVLPKWQVTHAMGAAAIRSLWYFNFVLLGLCALHMTSHLLLAIGNLYPKLQVRPMQLGMAIAILFVVGWSFRTIVRNQDYNDPTVVYAKNYIARPNNPRVAAVHGGDVYRAGNTEHGLELLRHAVSLPRANWAFRVDYAEMLLSSGKTDAALAEFEILRSYYCDPVLVKKSETEPIDATHMRVYLDLCATLIMKERYYQAEAILDKLLQHDPDHSHGHLQFYRGLVQMKLNNPVEMERHLPELREKHRAIPEGKITEIRQIAITESSPLDQLSHQLDVVLWCKVILGPEHIWTLEAQSLLLARLKRYSEAAVVAQQTLAAAEKENWAPGFLRSFQERVALFQAGKAYLPMELEHFRRESRNTP